MISVLFIDRAWPLLAELVKKFSYSVRGSGIHVLFLSEFRPSEVVDNFETINMFQVPQTRSLEDLQATYSFSLHKTLVTERSFYDYSSFRHSQCYSRLSEAQIAEKVTPYANALDYLIRERADLIIDWVPDSFVPSLAGPIAGHYGKPFRMFLPHYWWGDGSLILDRMDLTSTVIDHNYRAFYLNPQLCDRVKLDNIFKNKKTLFAFSQAEYTLSRRIRLVLNRRKSYEPLSIRNWLVRRINKACSKILIRTLIPRGLEPRDEPFLLFPIHTSPEASLLGTYPELADQFGLIKNISMNLPYGVKLYVKEHPYADHPLGLGYGFYRRLTTLPNVRIFTRNASLDKLIEHPRCLAVAVINGTSGLDAALKRKPVFVFGRAIYGAADCFIKPQNFHEFYIQLMRIIRGEFRFNEPALYAILNAMDASLIRADVNLAVNNSTALLNALPSIWRSYVESRAWEQTAPNLMAVGEAQQQDPRDQAPVIRAPRGRLSPSEDSHLHATTNLELLTSPTRLAGEP